MRIQLQAIELDTSIQCRAAIDTAVVDDYAEAMKNGDEFPAVELFGTSAKCWPADGWHRIFAAKKNGESAIAANLHQGGRIDALKAALSANAIHGHRRTNSDKRRAVEIALREFGTMSSRAIAEMCGVSNRFVGNIRPEPATVNCSQLIGLDGKERPARREARPERAAEPQQTITEQRQAQAIEGACQGVLKRLPRKDDADVMDRFVNTIEGALAGLRRVDVPKLSAHESSAAWRASLAGACQELRLAIKALANGGKSDEHVD